MDNLIVEILLSFAKDAFGGYVGPAYSWLYAKLWSIFETKNNSSVNAILEQVGCTTDDEIRRLVKHHTQDLKIQPEDREELTNLLISFAHSSRFLTTQGMAKSSVIRNADVLRQILQKLETVRKTGEPVSPGSSWRLTKFLGKGSFGEVWLCQNPGYHERCAFKFFVTTEGMDWLRAEGQTLFAIGKTVGNHPNIVCYQDIQLESNPFPFIRFEYLGGGSLENWILSQPQDRLSLDKANIIQNIVRGLAKAHASGISHRDLKPANILLTDDPRDIQAKITDFGLGKVERQSSISFASNVMTHVLVGTPLYLPPEASHPHAQRNPMQDDMFALGVVWYQLLVEKLDRPPYDFVDQLRDLGIDSLTIRLLSKCLAHPKRRFKDATELEQVISGIEMPEWQVPDDCYDIQHIVKEYLASQAV